MDPVRKLLDTSTLTKEEDKGPISPKDPWSPLPDKRRVCRRGMVHMHSGMLPWRVVSANVALNPSTVLWQLAPEVSLSNTSACKLVDEHMSAGSDPCMQLLYRSIVWSCLLKSAEGIVPVNPFCDKSKVTPAPDSLSDDDKFDPKFPTSA